MQQELILHQQKLSYKESLSESHGDAIVIFLHGWESRGNAFRGIFPKTHSYCALDFPGFGGSSPLLRPWTLTEYAEITAAFLEKKYPQKKLLFISHSFGGRVLLKMLSEKMLSHSIEHIICTGVPFLRHTGVREKVLRCITKVAYICTTPLPQKWRAFLQRQWYRCIGTTDYIDARGIHMKDTFMNIITEDICEYTRILRDFPTTFLWGENDTMAPLADAKTIAQHTGAELRVLTNGSHFPFLPPTQHEFLQVFQDILSSSSVQKNT